MKKKLLIMMILLSLTGCTKKEEPKKIKDEEKPKIENKVEEEKKKLDALITEYFPGKRRRFNAKKDIIHRKNLLYQKSMLNLEAA